MRTIVTAVALAVTAALGLTGCTGVTRVGTPDSAASSTRPPASSPAPASTPAAAEPAPAPAPTVGTRENPVPYDYAAPIENALTGSPTWEITVLGPSVVTADIAAANQFNDPPAAGSDYVRIPVHLVWNGTESVKPFLDYENGIEVAYVTTDGRTFEQQFVVSPWPSITDVGDLYQGGAADFSTIVQVPQGAAGTVRVTVGYDGLDVFWG